MSEYHDAETGEILPEVTHDIRVQSSALLCSPNVTEVWTALIQAQGVIEPPLRTKTATVKGENARGNSYEYEYKYAPLDEILSKARKPLADVGLGFQQFLVNRANQALVRTIIFHKSGEWTAIDYPIFWDTKKGASGFAAGVTTARRMGLTLALGLAPEDDLDHDEDAPATSMMRAPATRSVSRPEQTRPPSKDQNKPIESFGGEVKPSTGNGVSDKARPGWVSDFLIRGTYAIDPKKLNGLSAWETRYMQAVNGVDNSEQLAKLKRDNAEHIEAFKKTVRPEVFVQFLRRHDDKEAELKLNETAFVTKDDAGTILST